MTPRLEWRNWTGDQFCRPVSYEAPSSEGEIAELIDRAGERDLTVRVAGAGHSFTPAVLTSGLLMSLHRMPELLEVDRGSRLVRVGAGMTLNAFNQHLDRHGLALPNLGDIDVQTVAGALSTGTHGTGSRLHNLSAAVHSMELMLADGSTTEISESSDADAWRAARVSIGALGVITAVTFRAVPAFTLRGVDRPRPLDDVLESLDESVDGNDHFEFYTFPHSPLAQTRTNNRVDEAPRPRSRSSAWIDDRLTNDLFKLVCRLERSYPSTIPPINRLVSRVWGKSTRVDRSDRIFASSRRVRFTEMEYAIPRAHAAPAVRAVRRLVEDRGFHVPFPLEVRFVAGDDAFLSPAFGRETCHLSVHMFEGMEFEPYFCAVESIMDELDGRPHWGKRHFQTHETLRSRFPEWDRFASVRSRLDPEGRFANDYVRNVLGPPT